MDTTDAIVIAIYQSSCLIARTPALPPTQAWRMAVSYVRDMAHADGVGGGAGWYQTANRAVYERGIFRATPVLADRGSRRA
jgi:hypothetical protein